MTQEVNTGWGVTERDDRNLRPICYISGPMLSEGNAYSNIGDAIELGEIAYERGWAPFIPHLDCLVTMVTGNDDRDRYLAVDFSILAKCDCVCVLPYKLEENADGSRTGTSLEIDFAETRGIPVYTEETLPYVKRG